MLNQPAFKTLFRNPYLLFLPFLIVYIIIVLVLHQDQNIGDENRYLMFATNLLNGFYSPPPPCIDLGNGPGYPLFLVPFLAANLPLLALTIANAILQYLSIILVFKSLEKHVSWNLAVIFSLFWATFYNYYCHLPLIISESFTLFLLSAVVYSFVRTFERPDFTFKDPVIYLSGFVFGYLALTKPIFGYVILVLIAGGCFLFLFNRKSGMYKKLLLLLLVSFATTLPYLVYTYGLSGRLLYWGSNAGNNMYWMTSPFEEEYGSWYAYHKFEYDSVSSDAANLMAGGEQRIKANHRANHEEFWKYCGVEQDDAYKKAAMKNIREHPVKYLQNIASNMGRMLFNFPYSYTLQKPATLLRLPHNGILLVLMLVILIPAIRNWRKIPFSIRLLTLTALVYIGGSLLGSVETRMFTVAVPIFLLITAYVFSRTITIRFRFESQEDAN